MAKRNNDKDYYEVLQVHRKAEQEVIDAAYRKLAQKYHPDVSKDPNAAQRMKEINVAYEVLSDPNRRMEYDKHLEAKRGFKAAAQYKKEQLTASHFLVEFRLHGYAKKYAKWARARAHREARRLGIKELKGQRPVSHITLFGSAETNNLRRVIAEVERIGLKYTLIPFKIDGLSYFNNPDKKVIYLDVDPSLELEQFRRELAESLIRISTKYTEWDTKQKYKFHSTIGEFITSNDSKFEKLYNCVETKCSLKTFKQHQLPIFDRLLSIIKRYLLRAEEEEPSISQYLLRVTILRRERILCEYDLVLKKLLSRREALSRHWWRKTIEKLRALQDLPQGEHLPPYRRFRTFLGNLSSSRSVYLIGDTHFDHANIIRYCNRPFQNIEEMNETIVRNWNETVKDRDTVYFLGDWTFGRGHKPAKYWVSKLKGHIVSIRGAHDWREKDIRSEDFKVLQYHEYSFLLIHDPEQAGDWHSWIIHGHKHNNNMSKYPFINGERKTINVGVELINYTPISLDFLLSLNINSIKRMETINSQPERW